MTQQGQAAAMYVQRMTHIRIRDLQKISEETTSALKSGDRTVGLLVPSRRPIPARAEALARGRDPGRRRASSVRNVDPVDWSIEAVRALMAERA
jgi:hypothetical protein